MAAYYNKIGLLCLAPDCKTFLVSAKGHDRPFLMPGGQIEDGETDMDCLHREVKEELDCELELDSIKFINEYSDVSASHPDRDVDIRLYAGNLCADPTPSSEIKELAWIGVADIENPRISPIILHKIIPDLLEKGLLVR